VNAYHETFGTGGTLGRNSRSELYLVRYLRPALERLNPALPSEAIVIASTLTRIPHRSPGDTRPA
jgi:type I restriction enzyme R subunit